MGKQVSRQEVSGSSNDERSLIRVERRDIIKLGLGGLGAAAVTSSNSASAQSLRSPIGLIRNEEIREMISTLESAGLTDVAVADKRLGRVSPGVMFTANWNDAYQSGEGKVFAFVLPKSLQYQGWSSLYPEVFDFRDSNYNDHSGKVNSRLIPAGQLFGGNASAQVDFVNGSSPIYTFKMLVPNPQYQQYMVQPPQPVTDSTTIQKMAGALQNFGLTNVVADQSLATIDSPGVMFKAYYNKAYPTQGGYVLALALPGDKQYLSWGDSVDPKKFLFRDSAYNPFLGGLGFKVVPSGQFFGGPASAINDFVDNVSPEITFKILVPYPQYQKYMTQSPQPITDSATLQQMTQVINNAGFTSVSTNQSLVTVAAPGVAFSAYDKNAYPSQGGKVVIVAYPQDYQYLNWNKIVPNEVEIRDSSYNSLVNILSFGPKVPAGSWFGGRSSGLENFVNGTSPITWKELVPLTPIS